jgi:hypothetical protein
MYLWFPSILKVVTIIEPETLMRWHRAGFRRYWRWKSRSRGGRPQIDVEPRTLIRDEHRIFFGVRRVAQSTVATYMVRYARLLQLRQNASILHKDVPISRPIHQTGFIRPHPILGGLHHHDVRV